MAYVNEIAQKALLALLAENLDAALSSVALFWNSRSETSIALPSPVTFFEGHNPTVLELPSSAFPFISVIDAGRSPRSSRAAWGYQEQEISIFIDFFVVGSDLSTVNLVCQRYTQAVTSAIAASRVIEAPDYGIMFTQSDYEPSVTQSEASRHSVYTGDGLGGDMFDSSDVDFIKGARVTLNLWV